MSDPQRCITEIPTPEALFLDVPLYASFEIDSSNFEDVLRIESFQGTLDTYCIECEKESVFQVYTRDRSGRVEGLGDPLQKASKTPQDRATENRNFLLRFVCTRDADHALYFFCLVQDAKIMKIGQHPSLADLQSVNIKKYRKILGDTRYRELHKAIGLSAHGVGIGSFVYLRRIFENLIESAHAQATKEAVWAEEKFEESRMDERILMLRDLLPPFLVENRVIYSILSKGIHSLTEEECLEHFEPLRLSIELILDEKLEQKEQAKKISRAKQALGSIGSKLR